MSKLSIPEKTLLLSLPAWKNTHCEPLRGHPGEWMLVWRAEGLHGKIGGFIKSKKSPSKSQVKNALRRELLRRFKSPLRCDAKRVAYLWLQKSGKALPLDAGHVSKILQDALYDLDSKIAGEFFSGDGPKLFMAASHGWMLAELAEIRCMVSYLTSAIEKTA
jgi:hypothetical protein